MGLVIGNENYSWTEFETNAEYKEGFDKEIIGTEIVAITDFTVLRFHSVTDFTVLQLLQCIFTVKLVLQDHEKI